jgi:hypothetical protein
MLPEQLWPKKFINADLEDIGHSSQQVDLTVNGERWSPSKPNRLEVRVSSESFDSSLAYMVSACLPKSIFQGVALTRSVDLGTIFRKV